MIFERQSKNKKVLAAIFMLLAVAGVFYLASVKNSDEPESVACTQEAKLCPDGSYVGRTGPECAFAPCPDETGDPWQTITDTATGITFEYPEVLFTEYIHTVDWPPQLQIMGEGFTCIETESEDSDVGQTMKRMVNNRVYCVTMITEGAAGSIYTDYTYTFLGGGDKTIAFTFSLRAVQCANYNDPQKTACESERESFDLDSVVDRMAQSIALPE